MRADHGATASTELRILRQGPGAERARCPPLFLRMHLLRRLRRAKAFQCLSELRRRLCAAADPAREGMAAGRIGGKASAVGQACAAEIRARRHRCAFGADQERSARGTVNNVLRSFRGQDRALDLAEADAVTVALAPAPHDKRIAVVQERSLDTPGQFQGLLTVPADLKQAAALMFLR